MFGSNQTTCFFFSPFSNIASRVGCNGASQGCWRYCLCAWGGAEQCFFFLLVCTFHQVPNIYDHTGLSKKKVNTSICRYLFACLFLLASWVASMAVGIAAHAPSATETQHARDWTVAWSTVPCERNLARASTNGADVVLPPITLLAGPSVRPTMPVTCL